MMVEKITNCTIGQYNRIGFLSIQTFILGDYKMENSKQIKIVDRNYIISQSEVKGRHFCVKRLLKNVKAIKNTNFMILRKIILHLLQKARMNLIKNKILQRTLFYNFFIGNLHSLTWGLQMNYF